jgi:hypothetical protein
MRGYLARVGGRLQRAVLGVLMSSAVIVLERRIRKALRRDQAGRDRAGSGRDQAGSGRPAR